MAAFGFVHGAYHGSWCWEGVAADLRRRGHDVAYVDLPSEDPTAGAVEYARVAVHCFDSLGDDLIVVGHSLGGLTLPIIASHRPVKKFAFICAMLPRVGRSHRDAEAEEPDMFLPSPPGGTIRTAQGMTIYKPEYAVDRFFSDCPKSAAIAAASRLRGQCWKILQEVCPLEKWPDIPSVYFLGTKDRVLNPSWARRVVPRVLNIDPIELEVPHAAFLAAPSLVADMLEAEA